MGMAQDPVSILAIPGRTFAATLVFLSLDIRHSCLLIGGNAKDLSRNCTIFQRTRFGRLILIFFQKLGGEHVPSGGGLPQ